MKSALEQLITNLPAEFGGATATDRFLYQNDFTFCLILKLHSACNNYLVICDYHDDVLHVDDSSVAAKVHFYQVKSTSKKPWTIERLIKQKLGQSGSPLPSVLGKLCRHRLNFGDVAGTLNFVTNLPFTIKLKKDVTKTYGDTFTLVDIDETERTKALKSLQSELALPSDPPIDASLLFHISDLPLAQHSTHVQGRLTEFLGKKVPGREQFPIGPIYRVVSDEIARRAGYSKPCTAIVELEREKGIGRSWFEDFLVASLLESDRKAPSQILSAINSNLSSESVSFGVRTQIHQCAQRFSIERLDESRGDIRSLVTAAKQHVHTQLPLHVGGFFEFIESSVPAIRQASKQLTHTDHYIMATVAWETVAYDWGHPPTASKLENTKA